ncbi:DUF3237 family protein [Streptomyces sp. NPDC060053]|uniref:DUF3237 family protein n=1 Tax=Streptomyces sp. NPDC060053 TaxID=3347047 RepID=UPI0036C09887
MTAYQIAALGRGAARRSRLRRLTHGRGVLVVAGAVVAVADDGAVIDIVNRGYYPEHADSPDLYDGDLRLAEAGTYFRTAPVFRTDAPRHRWLARTVFVGLAREEDGHIVIRCYTVD